MSYEKLLDDLESLQKSYAAEDKDDKAIQAAAADGDKDEDDEKLDEDGKPVAKKDDGDDEKEGNPFAKSFTGTTEDGEPFEAIDGTELIKSLSDKIDGMEQGAAAEKEDLAKSLTILADVLKRQGTLIKSLQESYVALANSGNGRKSVIAPTLDLVKSLQNNEPLNAGSFMLKANAAYDAGRITGKDLTVCDVALRHGTEIDPTIINKVMAG